MERDDLQAVVQEEVEKAVATSSNKLLADLDELISAKLSGVQDNLARNQMAVSNAQIEAINNLKLMKQPVFKRKGNEEQFKFNLQVSEVLESTKSNLDAPLSEQSLQTSRDAITKGIGLISHRQKLIRLADQSDAGWSMVGEYESNELAADSDDERRIFKAEARANKKLKDAKIKKSRKQIRFDVNAKTAYSIPSQGSSGARNSQAGSMARQMRKGVCFGCGKAGHYRFECGAITAAQEKISKITVIPDKVRFYVENQEMQFATVDNKTKGRDAVSNVNVKHAVVEPAKELMGLSPAGRLRHYYTFWQEAGANDYILGVIKHGYRLPFYDMPPNVCCKNNKSSLDNPQFVAHEIENLLKKGCISKTTALPKVVNPLTVVANKLGKQRLVLDCRTINLFLMKYKFKLEDIAIAKQLFAKGDYLFTFDLMSAYHHVEICPDHRTYLGFSWIHGNEIGYYVFNVLPFGVSTAAYIFTKVTRVMVAYWRRQGYRIAMYIDDGCGAADTLSEAMVVSNEVRSSTIKFGFLIAEEKCQWLPSNNVTWLGHILDMEAGIICVTDDRVKGLLGSIKELLLQVTNGNIYVKVRIAASIVGKIISMHNAIGPLVRLKTRCLYTCIETRSSWSGLIKIDSKALDELMFWLENITSLNGKVLHKIEHASVSCFSDASGTGYGGFVVEHDQFDHMGLWSFDEQSTSSTWRELEAVARVLNANKECLSNQLVQWFTDNQNVVRILEAGSKVPHLHRKALEIYDNCQGSSIRLWPEWIPRGLNARADMLSKGGDCDDWTISREAFAFVDSEFGPHTIDRFASGYNCKCVRFNSKWHFEGTEGIDAFAQSWKDDNNWLVPPPRLATFVLQKLEADSGYGTLVVPEWSSAPFWSKLCNIHGLFHTFVKGSIVMDANDIIVKGRGKNGVFGLSLGERVKDSIRSKDTELVRLAGLLPSILVGSRSENTSRKYWSYFKKWEQFAKDRGNLSVLPGNSVHVALYLTSLVEAKASISIISSAFYSIKWAHNLAGELDPTSHPFVINVLENAKRTCSKPVIKKDPVNSEHLINLCEKYKDTVDLLIVRDLAMMLLCYCGFFRFNELINLRCNNISMFDNYFSCTILKSKTDQFRLGSQVLISKLKSVACPYNMLVRYINLARLDLTTEIFVFRSVIRSGVACKLSSGNKSLSYTRTREVILGRLKEVEKNGNFGLHSLRAGGATAAANANVLDRCFKRHGRWRSETAKDGYVADSIESRLKVSQNLGL